MHPFRLYFKRLLLLLGDYVVFQLALIGTLLLRYGTLSKQDWQAHLLPFSILSVIWIMSFYVAGLYELALTRDSLKFFRTYLEGMLANLAIALGFFYLIPVFGIAPRTNLLLYFACALLVGYVWRLFYNRKLSPKLFRNRVLFVGAANDAARVHSLLQGSASGFELVAVAETSPGTRFDTGSITWYVNVELIDHIIKAQNIHTIVLGHRPDDIPGLRDALYKTLFTPVALIDRAALEEAVTGRVPLEYVSQTWFLENLREHEKAWYDSSKRLFDLLLAIPFGLFTLLLLPFIAALIKLSSPGTIFFSQQRVGKGGKNIYIWKFRSMKQGAESAGPCFTASAATDPRLTAVGRKLRQLRLDELPQIWSVLRGDLSFIGPRPERPEFVAPLIERMPYYALRHLTRPGLTGWAQVKLLTPVAALEDNLNKLRYDLYYIKNRSPFLDAAILLKTIGIILRQQGT